MAKQRLDLAKTGYIVNDNTLAALARQYVSLRGQTEGVRGSYLRILTAHTLKELEDQKIKSPSKAEALLAIDTVHRHLYSVVLDAITTPDVANKDGLPPEEASRRSRERNRRSTFARSAKSVLRSWVRHGGKIEKLVPADVRKDDLQETFQASPKKRVSLEGRVNRVEKRLESLVKRVVDRDPEAAKRMIKRLQSRLAALVPSARSTGRVTRKPVSAVAVSTH